MKTEDDVVTPMVEEARKPFVYHHLDEAAVKVLAQDIYAGRVFGTWNVPEGEDIRLPFMLFAFLARQDLEEMQEQKVAHVYEYLHKAGPRSVNGMPSFFSHNFLNDTDAKRVFETVEKIRRAVETAVRT